MPVVARASGRRWTLKPPLGTPLLAGTPLAAGLVAHWGMNDGGGSLVQTQGRLTTPAVLSGSAWSWRANVAPLFLCPTFPGNTTDLITMTHQAALSPLSKTVAVWFLTTSAAAVFQHLAYKGLDFILRLETSRRLGWYIWTGGTVRTLNPFALAVPVGVPVHAVGTWDGTTMRAYQNGVAGTTAAPGGVTSTGTNDILFGGDSLAADSLYGSLGMVTLWDRALSAAEVMELYVNPFALFARPRALLTGPPVTAVGPPPGGGAGLAVLDVGHRRRGPGPILG